MTGNSFVDKGNSGDNLVHNAEYYRVKCQGANIVCEKKHVDDFGKAGNWSWVDATNTTNFVNNENCQEAITELGNPCKMTAKGFVFPNVLGSVKSKIASDNKFVVPVSTAAGALVGAGLGALLAKVLKKRFTYFMIGGIAVGGAGGFFIGKGLKK